MTKSLKKFYEIVKETRKCKNSDDLYNKLMEYGFTYVEDDCDNDIAEENQARPETPIQKTLVAYFESSKNPSLKILELFKQEKESESTNYPLIRKYFRASNQKLKALILFGIQQEPCNIDFYYDLLFYSEFSYSLIELSNIAINACINIECLSDFENIVQDFYYFLSYDEYDLYLDLLSNDKVSESKKDIINKVIDNKDLNIYINIDYANTLH